MLRRQYVLKIADQGTIQLYCKGCQKVIEDLGYTPAPVEAILAQTDHHDVEHKHEQYSHNLKYWKD